MQCEDPVSSNTHECGSWYMYKDPEKPLAQCCQCQVGGEAKCHDHLPGTLDQCGADIHYLEECHHETTVAIGKAGDCHYEGQEYKCGSYFVIGEEKSQQCCQCGAFERLNCKKHRPSTKRWWDIRDRGNLGMC